MKVIQPMNGRVRAPKPGSLLKSVLFLLFVKTNKKKAFFCDSPDVTLLMKQLLFCINYKRPIKHRLVHHRTENSGVHTDLVPSTSRSFPSGYLFAYSCTRFTINEDCVYTEEKLLFKAKSLLFLN